MTTVKSSNRTSNLWKRGSFDRHKDDVRETPDEIEPDFSEESSDKGEENTFEDINAWASKAGEIVSNQFPTWSDITDENVSAQEEGSEVVWEDYLEDPEVHRNPDGQWTARDLEWELTAQGSTVVQALNSLGRVIAAVQGEAGHTPTEEEIRDLGADPDDGGSSDEEDIPDFLQ
ncbi:type II toxin-antitoxin system HicB family antitoxin [Halosimplex marinum]|uniref:type II toxin-antitoxin system HicB family antitoxin n=1 Tax=Halosimplex marinum TaxID=3396620 RepID=UPI003F56DC85